MFRKIGQVLMIVAVLTATGSHWLVLQSVAWTTMLTCNLRSCCVSEAIEKTFDGKHPCCLCKEIAVGKKSERKKELTLQMQKFEFPPFEEKLDLIPPSVFHLLVYADSFAELSAQEPPVPPPRYVFA